MTATLKLSEDAFQQQVIDFARLYRWRVAHFRAAQTAKGWRTAVAADGAGFPDLVLVRGTELIFAELKTDTGRLGEQQKAWLEELAAVSDAVTDMYGRLIGMPGASRPPATVDVVLWRPRDWDDIVARLARPEPASPPRAVAA